MRKLGIVLVLLVLVPVVAVFAHNGLWPDQIVFFEEVEQSKVLAMMQTGDVHLYGNSFAADLYQDILDYGLPVTFSYGSFNELLLNPAVDANDAPFFQDGRFNAFGLQSVREAMYYKIDRNYIIEEILVGLGVARWTMLDPNFPPYAQAIETCRALELKYQHDEAKAYELIEADMLGAGAVLVDGKWNYNGEPVVIIGIIRIEDERLEIGDYFADILEANGFTVERRKLTSGEASPIWLLSDPTEGQWGYYTGGWISNLIDRDQGGDFDFMYTPRGLAVPLNQGYPMHLFPEADAAFDKLARRDYSTIAERVELLGIAEQGAADCGWNQWIFSSKSPWATAADVSVLVDVAAGISGAFIWAHTARFVDADGAPVVGGTMRMASPSMMTQPWNPVAGSNWLYDAMIQRATQDWYIFPDPFTGLGQPHLIESAVVTIQEGVPMGSTLDYVTVETVPVIDVPADAWVDWDPVYQRFVTVGEKFPDGLTAKTKTTATYVADLFENPWHDGSVFSFADMLLTYIMSFDLGMPDSPYYDEANVASLAQFLTVHKGFKVLSVSPLRVEIYDDRFYLDAEVQVFNRLSLIWPDYSQGMAPWHAIAVGLLAEEAGTTVFSEDKADFLGVDRQNWIAGEQLVLLDAELETAVATSFVPYAPTLGGYITTNEVVTRYANLGAFRATYGHMWVGNGPLMVGAVDPIAKIITGMRFEGYRHDMAKFLAFAAPRMADVAVTDPDTVTIGDTAEFAVAITEDGEAYPAADMSEIKYLVFDATGALAFSGAGVITGDGAATVTLTAYQTAQLILGSATIEIIAVLKTVARVARSLFSFFVDGENDTTDVLPGQGISFSQVDFTWEDAELLESNTGQIDVDVDRLRSSTGRSHGFVNVATPLGWVVQNLPIMGDYPYATISTRFQLSTQPGENIIALDAYVEFSPEPLISFIAKELTRFNVGNTEHNAQGHGPALLAAPLCPPLPGAVGFILGGAIRICWQAGHQNVETACNQCAPAAAANSLDWLRRNYQLAIPHAHIPGLVGCPTDSLVAQLDLAMVRKAGLTWPSPPAAAPAGLANVDAQRMTGEGVLDYEFVRGKLAYLANNGLGGWLLIEHQDDAFGALNATWCRDTSFGRGNPPTAQFIINRVCRNADVEVGYTWDKGGGHMVNVVGAGTILGVPWIAHISDHDQSDTDLPPDLRDNRGTGFVDFTFLIDIDVDGLLNLVFEQGQPELDVAVSEEMQ